MTDETTTDQLAEIEGQGEQPQPVQVREGRWRTRNGEIKNIRACEPLKGAYYVWPWTDGFMTFQDNGRHQGSQESPNDLVEYLGLIEPQPEPQPEPRPQPRPQPQPEPQPENSITPDNVAGQALAGVWNQAKAERTIEELRCEVHYVQRQLGESRQRVTQLEELVASLRTINEAQEKTVRLAGQANTDLQHRLDVVSAEWAEQAGTINGLRAHVEAVEADVVQERLERNRYQNQVLRLTAELDNKTTECRNLQIELDALQQAPQAETVATAPTSKDDRFEEGWDAGTSQAVETVLEWLEPIRYLIDAADNMAETEQASNLAADIIRALPAIMRSLTGLTPED